MSTISFDFIHDEILRTTLESDSTELEKCLNAGAWKAVHVLSGSIIEAILVDYLLEIGYEAREGKDIKKINFFNIINICKDEGILSARTTDLSHVIREYRNMIHPEKILRAKESVDENSAIVAHALVRIVVGEISAIRKKNYGYTAEQIIKKIETDPSVASILPHFLKETKNKEKKRLLLSAIPDKYILWKDYNNSSNNTQESENILSTLEKCYQLIQQEAPREVKKEIAANFVRVLKEEDTDTIKIYETTFFWGDDLIHYPPEEISLVTTHIITTLLQSSEPSFIEKVSGISPYLQPDQLIQLIDLIIRVFLLHKYPEWDVEKVKQFLDSEYWISNQEAQSIYMKRLEAWKDIFAENEKTEALDKIGVIIEYLKIEPMDYIDSMNDIDEQY